MQWEIILAVILAIGVGMTIKQVFEKRLTYRKKHEKTLLNGYTFDGTGAKASKQQPSNEKSSERDNPLP